MAKKQGPVSLRMEHAGDLLLATVSMLVHMVRGPYPSQEEIEADLDVWEALLRTGSVPGSQKGRLIDSAKLYCVKVDGDWRRVSDGPFAFSTDERDRLEWARLVDDPAGGGKRLVPIDHEPPFFRWSAGRDPGSVVLLKNGRLVVEPVPFPDDDERFAFYRGVLETAIGLIRESLREGDIETARTRFWLTQGAVWYMAGRAEGIDPPRWRGKEGGRQRAIAMRKRKAERNEKLAKEVERLMRERSLTQNRACTIAGKKYGVSPATARRAWLGRSERAEGRVRSAQKSCHEGAT